ncbi:hypothetical protein [uncultured Fibrella sp.]|uniref:hypothetical protein n=1 Tax=uncultured Fibrella sp. TaxID=1284596 RepID=UPI0035CCA488
MKNSLFATIFGVATITAVLPSVAGEKLMLTFAAVPTPAAVKATITRLYPTAKGVKYEKENAGYEVGFTHNGKAMSVVLDAKGVVKETETVIAVSDLPAAIRNYIAKRMPGKPIKEAAEIVDAKGVKVFEAEVGGKDLLFNTTGKPLN